MSQDDKKDALKANLLEFEQQTRTTEKGPENEKELTLAQRFKTVFGLAYMPIFGSLFHPIYTMVNAAVLGREGTDQLAGFGLGSLTLGIMVISIQSSFSFGASTFISQAYGAGDLESCAIYRNRQCFLNACMFLLLLIPQLFIHDIYIAIGQNPEIAIYATQYVHTVLPGIFFYSQSQPYASFSSSQRVTWYTMASTITGTAVHALLVWLFYGHLGWGFTGICWATTFMWFTRFAVNFGLVTFGGRFKSYDNVKLFSRQTVSLLPQQIIMGLKSMSMSLWGWWAFDIFTLMASYLATEIIAAQTVMRSIGLLTFMLPVGFASACGTLVGNSVGQGNFQLAMSYYRVCIIVSLAIAAFQVIMLVSFRDIIIGVFTTQEDIAEQMTFAWVVFQIFVIFDATQAVGSSVIRGTGKQGMGSFVTITAYWVIGIPISATFVFYYTHGIQGLWYGPTFATAFNTFMYNVLIKFIDWDEVYATIQARKAKEAALKIELAAKKEEEEEEQLRLQEQDKGSDDSFKRPNQVE